MGSGGGFTVVGGVVVAKDDITLDTVLVLDKEVCQRGGVWDELPRSSVSHFNARSRYEEKETAIKCVQRENRAYLGRNARRRDGISPILIWFWQPGLCNRSCNRRDGSQSEDLKAHGFPNEVYEMSTKTTF